MPQDEIKKDENQDDALAMALEKIDNLEKNTVSKEKYDKLNNQLRTVMGKYLDNQKDEKKEETDEKVDKKELLEILRNPETPNIKFAEAALKLRKHVMDKEGYDPFIGKVSYNPEHPITDEVKKRGQFIADAMQACLDVADGNPEIFNSEWNLCIRDVRLPRQK